jgi:hypothetical protein
MSDAAVLKVVDFAVGVAATLLAGAAIPYLMRQTRSAMRMEPPPGIRPERWQAVTDIGDEARRPIEWLGKLERILFFISFWLSVYEIAGGWLVFKLGSKWQSWQTIVKVPESPPSDVHPLDYLAAKNRWASATLQRWLFGNLLNVLVAFLGVAVSVVTRWWT